MSDATALETEVAVLTVADVARYCDDVIAGRIVVGELVRLAVERHLRDLERQDTSGFPFYFDEEAANRRLEECALVSHIKGPLAGERFTPAPWQAFILAAVHGWRRSESGLRRCRVAYVQVAKKNGKTFLLIGEGFHGLGFDGELGAEVYSIATAEEQAKLSWSPARTLLTLYPDRELGRIFEFTTKTIHDESTGSRWAPLGRDSRTHEGKNTSTLLADELHAHPDGELVDNMRAGMAARSQPLTIFTTTAGTGRESYCYGVRAQAEKVLRGISHDETFFAYVAELDKGDDWRDESVWPKANPSLGLSVSLEFLREERDRALANPRLENSFRRYHCDEWVEQVTRWLPMHKWDECSAVPTWNLEAARDWREARLRELRGQRCRAGLDMARTTDLCAFVLLFEPLSESAPWIPVPWFWIPRAKVDGATGQADGVPFAVWERLGFVTIHDGDVIDENLVEEDVFQICKPYRLEQLRYDPACGGTGCAIRLADRSLPMVECSQGWETISPASKKLEEIVLARRLDHGANPVLRWNAANVAIKTDSNDNYRPAKDKSTGRIDGIAALIMALSGFLVKQKDRPKPSYYNSPERREEFTL